MINSDDVRGIEFDWFAVDAEGNFAIFCTAGGGLIPAGVVPLIETFKNVSQELKTPNWGTDKVWDDYADLGLFVFDSDYAGRPYRLIRVSEGDLDAAVRTRLSGVVPIPRYDGNFGSVEEIGIWKSC